jgi:hypothetical protein
MEVKDFENINLYNFEDETHVAIVHLIGNEEDFVYGMSEKEAIGLEKQLNSLCANNSEPLTDYVIGPWEE